MFDIKINVVNWLARYHQVNEQDFRNALKDEKATSYLLIWSIFEQRIFNGFMKVEIINNTSQKFEKHYSSLDIDSIAQKFHTRYQNKEHYQHLIHSKDNITFRSIINMPFENISEFEKLQMLFFIVYRYRNNIFHGNKKVLTWTKYTEQIEDCLLFITRIIDLNQKEMIIEFQK